MKHLVNRYRDAYSIPGALFLYLNLLNMASPLSRLNQPFKSVPDDGIAIPTSDDKVARCSAPCLCPVQIENQVMISLHIMVLFQINIDIYRNILGVIGV